MGRETYTTVERLNNATLQASLKRLLEGSLIMSADKIEGGLNHKAGSLP